MDRPARRVGCEPQKHRTRQRPETMPMKSACHASYGQAYRPRPHPPGVFEAKASSIDGEVWLDAEVPVNRADFGLTWNQMGMASMDNTINIHAVFPRRP
jgi:hypothetical protein